MSTKEIKGNFKVKDRLDLRYCPECDAFVVERINSIPKRVKHIHNKRLKKSREFTQKRYEH